MALLRIAASTRPVRASVPAPAATQASTVARPTPDAGPTTGTVRPEKSL
ncbi:MAG: hypothetical protein IPI03_01515 [Rubrivivax sp.]|nr:hypothetical protein [Rubrivivax sp.]